MCSRGWCVGGLGSFMRAKHRCVLVRVWTRGEVGAPLSQFRPSSEIFLLTLPGQCFFCGSFMLSVSCFVVRSGSRLFSMP